MERLLLKIEESKMAYVIIKVNANNQAKPRKILQHLFLLISAKCKDYLSDVYQEHLNILTLLATDELHEWVTSDLESILLMTLIFWICMEKKEKMFHISC